MSQDKGRHREIRKEISKRFLGNKFFCTSHESKGDIKFYKLQGTKYIFLAEPDIVVNINDASFIVEIELTNSPKHLLGVALAIYSSEFARYDKRKEYTKIGKKSLLIIVDSKRINKENSEKPEQIQTVKEIVKEKLKFEFFDIVTEDIAKILIDKWIGKV